LQGNDTQLSLLLWSETIKVAKEQNAKIKGLALPSKRVSQSRFNKSITREPLFVAKVHNTQLAPLLMLRQEKPQNELAKPRKAS
jgi:hypothetical protein